MESEDIKGKIKSFLLDKQKLTLESAYFITKSLNEEFWQEIEETEEGLEDEGDFEEPEEDLEDEEDFEEPEEGLEDEEDFEEPLTESDKIVKEVVGSNKKENDKIMNNFNKMQRTKLKRKNESI